MVRPFIILALNRSGSTMVSRAISEHPDIPPITHEFRGDEARFWEHPYVLSNFLRPWMLDDKIVKVHLWREDYVGAAKSLFMMGYNFPDGFATIAPERVLALAEERRDMDAKFRDAALFSISYENLCHGKQITQLPTHFTAKLCAAIDVPTAVLPVDQVKGRTTILRNEDDIKCLCLA